MALFDLLSLPSWRDQLQPASFRGVPFHIEEHGFSGGRSVAVHTFPLREVVATEDLGAAVKKYRLTGYVIGDGYIAARNALADACLNIAAPGLLVHPYLGALLVRCEECAFSETRQDGGVARFTLAFVEAGGQKAFVAEEDSRAASLAALRQVMQLARTALGLALGVRNWSAFVRSAFQSAVSGLASDLAGGLLGLPGLDPVGIASSVSTLAAADITAPDSLALAVSGPFQAVADAAASLPAPAASGSAAAAGAGDAATTSRGEAAERQGWVGEALLPWASYSVATAAGAGVGSIATLNASTAALAALVADAAVASAAQAFLAAGFADAAAAEAAFAALSSAMAARVQSAADRFDDALWPAWQAAAALLQRDFAARLRLLPLRGAYRLPAPVPALVLAQKLYAAPARADELVALNTAPHPMFLPASGVALTA